jgi:hypothetical protein
MAKATKQKYLYRLVLLPLLGFFAFTLPVWGQNHELAFSLGGTPGQTRGFNSPTEGQLEISASRSFGVTYGYRFAKTASRRFC